MGVEVEAEAEKYSFDESFEYLAQAQNPAGAELTSMDCKSDASTSFTRRQAALRCQGRKKRQLQQEGDRGEEEDHH